MAPNTWNNVSLGPGRGDRRLWGRYGTRTGCAARTDSRPTCHSADGRARIPARAGGAGLLIGEANLCTSNPQPWRRFVILRSPSYGRDGDGPPQD